MNYLLIFTLFSSLLTVAYSATYLEGQIVIPGHEKECYDKKDDVFYKEGEEMKWKRTECGRKICMGADRRGRVFAEIQTCGTVRVPPECHLEVNSQLPYPECCGMIVCPETADSEEKR